MGASEHEEPTLGPLYMGGLNTSTRVMGPISLHNIYIYRTIVIRSPQNSIGN